MKAIAPALLYALFLWWFTTGLVLLLVLRQRRAVSLAIAVALFPVALLMLVRSSALATIAGAYFSFTAAILLWGTQEIAFLTGGVTGPRPRPCPPGARGAARFRAALGAILYHEIALLVAGVLVVATTWGAPNQVAALTFLVLWTLRLSAKLNLFLGVPVLNDDVLPPRIAFVRSYFKRGPVNDFFPVSIVASLLALAILIGAALQPDVVTATEVGHALVAALLALAVLEHLFMLIPLPVARLWAWSTGRLRGPKVLDDAAPHDGPTGQGERAVATPL